MDRRLIPLVLFLSLAGGMIGGALQSRLFGDGPVPQPPKTSELIPEQPPQALYARCAKEEVDHHCANASTDLLKLADCMDGVRDRLTADCGKNVAAVNAILLPCRDEVKTFCADIPLGGGRLHKCLVENFKRTASACQTALNARRRPE